MQPETNARHDATTANANRRQGAQRYMLKSTNMRMSARLALLSRANPLAPEALLFEVPTARHPDAPAGTSASTAGGGGGSPCTPGPGSPARRGALVHPADATAGVVASQLDLENTLLASAVRQQHARFVKDCCSYCQVRRGAARSLSLSLPLCLPFPPACIAAGHLPPWLVPFSTHQPSA
jgi:hypothetical protein